jgi:hypothetical protein
MVKKLKQLKSWSKKLTKITSTKLTINHVKPFNWLHQSTKLTTLTTINLHTGINISQFCDTAAGDPLQWQLQHIPNFVSLGTRQNYSHYF